MANFDIPVFITIWDRPDYVLSLINVLKKIQPSKLYVFSDIVDNIEEKRYSNILESREIIKNKINWDVQIFLKYNKKNEGPSWGIYNAIKWAFEQETKLIVLEHDYIPALPFFPYCKELLERYEYDERIWLISGLNHFSGDYNLNNEDSYFFSKFASIAGFATWKRSWDKVDNRMKEWPTFLAQNQKFEDFTPTEWSLAFKKYDAFYRKRVLLNNLNTWDMQFMFSIYANRGTGIVPASNLINMIGVDGFNSSGKPSPFHFMSVDNNYFIKNHPKFIVNNWNYDRYYINNGFFYSKKTIFQRILNRIKKNLNLN